MAKLHFRDYNPKQILLFPQRLDKDITENDPVCPMGQNMTRVGTRHTKTESGYVTEKAVYRAQRCEGCPLRCRCFTARGNRRIEVNYRMAEYRRKAAERLTSEEGLRHRGRRCIEPETVFGQMKFDMAYKRFRHFGLDKVKMDFAFFAIAFNLKKMCSAIARKGKIGDNTPLYNLLLCLFMTFGLQKKTYNENYQKSVA